MMKKWFLHSMVCLLAFIGVACSDDAGNMPMDNAGNVRIRLQLALPAGGGMSRADYFENGVELENYIDFNDEDQYRIYFFDSDNKFIARFMPTVVDMSLENQYILYQVEGDVPEKLVSQSETMDFKIVVLGNWDTYQEPVAGTTIADICNDTQYGTFGCFTDGFDLNKSDKLIPFYGVHEYKGITFKDKEIVMLAAPITLLRAMAKVEVVLKTEGMSFSSVSIQGYNRKGYCAPSDVDSQEDYDYDADQPTLHLIGGTNDEGAASRSLPFLHIEGEDNDTWIAYLPEYDNRSDESEAAHIEVRFDIQTEDDENDFIIYFSDDQDDKSKTFDIVRNNLYRFNVTIDPKGKLAVEVNKWDEIFENNFIF